MNYVDIIIIAIILIYVLVGYFKGFVVSILSLFSFPIKLIVSILVAKPALMLVNGVFGLDVSLASSITAKYTKISPLFGQSMADMTQAEIDAHINNCLEATNYHNTAKSFLKSVFPIKEGHSAYTFGDVLGKTFGSFYSFVITLIAVFIILTLVIFIIKRVSKKLNEKSVLIKHTDRTLGLVVGLIRGIITVFVILTTLSWLRSLSFLDNFFVAVDTSFLGGFITRITSGFIDKYVNIKEIAKWFIGNTLQ